MAQKQTVVIDSGSFRMKVGLTPSLSSSEEKEEFRMCFPATVGRPHLAGVMIGSKSEYFGDEAVSKRGMLKLTYPISKGIVSNWDDAEKIWKYSLDDLKRINEEIGKSVLMTDSPLNTLENREKMDREQMTEIMFEKFRVQGLYSTSQAALSVFASGRTTGLVLDSGDDVTHSVPVYEGSALPHATLRMDFGGRELTNYMMEMVTKKGLVDKEIARDIKENVCYVALNYEEEYRKVSESQESVEKIFELPDGNHINLDCERYQCPEIFFQPKLFNIESENIIETICNTITKSDLDIRADFRANIILSGGGTMFSGMDKRISKELISLFPEYKYKIKVAPPLGDESVWLGGSLMASFSSSQNLWLTDFEYQEEGPSIVHRKFY
ncbi:hypothetical protein NAEGRDRAFT_33917 [Naegleria gruberi]|uniref:Actin n=1 Tax=Naegleria gruberi TaxID=5762 RepID=D2VGH4_NAEGR|nr:uncharacterized protein NAEGRDRAFT_33917 [Naegleria gruberi]EFC44065.1 hypothetical protein NAEGRDRAFT_33917 [Naegleria gruberi]|eukprot:XP_002676809.1 hypothetical protein NAEGRDRAFT_33917 [Naegleria gruberi strain NEG-M]